MAGKAAVIGSGIGGGTAAMVLSAAGWQVVVGPNEVDTASELNHYKLTVARGMFVRTTTS